MGHHQRKLSPEKTGKKSQEKSRKSKSYILPVISNWI